VARPGFDRLVAWSCAGKVGAVLCFDASRLARNGRDWHHLLELCGLVEARVIDLDGVYNPCRPNDRLLLGMKGSISEFELGVLRSRMLDAARSKASEASCGYRFRSATSGTVKSGLGSSSRLALDDR
jgi:DNA invertase Pin-like site-specific DNA recombinase